MLSLAGTVSPAEAAFPSLQQIIDLHEATNQSRGCRAPRAAPAQRTMSLDRIPVTQIGPDTMHCSPATPFTALGAPELPLPVHQGSSTKVDLLGSFSHPRWTHNTLSTARFVRELSQRAFNHLTEAEDTQAMRSSDKGAQQH